MPFPSRALLMSCFVMAAPFARSQDATGVIRTWLQQKQAELGLTAQDAAEWSVTSSHTDRKGITYVYIRQEAHALPVHGAVASFAVREGAIVSFGDRLQRNVATRVMEPAPALDAVEAVRHAARQLHMPVSEVHLLRTLSPTRSELEAPGTVRGSVTAQLIHQPLTDGRIRLAWDLTLRSARTPNWWHVAVDALTGELLRTTDHVVQCAVPAGTFARSYDALDDLVRAPDVMPLLPPGGSGYRVFAYPVESPSHGPRTLVIDPADPVASPFGWHDVDGVPGAESTITQGNNVYAGEDLDNDDFIGYSPDGGLTLNFDHPFTPPQDPVDHLDASITNLFHACNVLHDVWYRYGFDEESGNFQNNNYGHGGMEFDEVMAQAQDGGGMNNANFATPPDGSSGQMQMYLYRVAGDSALTIETPATIEGIYPAEVAGFGPALPEVPLTAEVVLVEDDDLPFTDGCGFILNPGDLFGRIALVDRGQCTFVEKVIAMENAGAVGVIVANNTPGAPFGMGGSGGEGIGIPSVMISLEDGITIRNAMPGGPVMATLQGSSSDGLLDSDLDNGIIAHEYGHGVSNRLTGGSANADCLWNAEQMGEGWSDWMGLMMTMRPGDLATTPRGVGTYVRDEEPSGVGIRPAPYTTDMSVNNFTYGATNDPALTEPHGVGFVWATLLWDVAWSLIAEEGFDPDLYNGDGGNTTAIQLMMDGLKLQPCEPGFVDGRDAILRADTLNYEATHACTIWTAFARRGLGYSADQGSSFDRFDQVEAFDVPTACIVGLTDAQRKEPRSLQLVPNPANTHVTVTLDVPSVADGTVRILGADGRVVRSMRLPAGFASLYVDASELTPGLYVVDVSMVLGVTGASGRSLKGRLVVVK